MSKIRAIAFLLLCAPVPAFALFTPLAVGPGCNYSTIGAALLDVADGGVIYIKPGTYKENLKISGKTVTIKGRSSDCSASQQSNLSPVAGPDESIETIIDGGGKGPVLTLTSFVNLSLNDVRITNGANMFGAGGGISFTAGGALTLTRTIIEHNVANNGGGIAVNPSTLPNGDTIPVIIGEGTLISMNSASNNGGGVYLSGPDNDQDYDVQFFMTQRNTSIANNTAGNEGGGLYVAPKVEVDIGSPGYLGYFDATYAYASAIQGNQAVNGAGIAVDEVRDKVKSGSVRLFSTQAHEPVRIQYNGNLNNPAYSKTNLGGGIFQFSGRLCGWGYSISNNAAGAGAAIFSDTTNFSRDYLGTCNSNMNDVARGLPQNFAECAVGDICNEINSNTAQPENDNNNDGQGIVVNSYHFEAERFQMRGNTGSRVLSSYNTMTVRNCLIAGNTVATTDPSIFAHLIRIFGSFSMDGCTVADNNIDNRNTKSDVFNFNSTDPDTLINSISVQPNIRFENDLGTLTVHDVIVKSNPQLYDSNKNILPFDPLFVDPLYGNYYLQATSPGIDYTATCTPGTDLFGNLRGGVILRDANKPCDIGAYERQKGPAAATFPYNENFDELDPFAAEVPAKWVNTVTMVDPTLVSTTPGWGATTASPYLGLMAMHAIEPGYVSDSTLETPSFTVVSSGVVTFWHQFDLENGYGGVVLDISLDDGSTYNDILVANGQFLSGGGYSKTLAADGCGPNPLYPRAVWTGSTPGYQKVVILLPTEADHNSKVRLRWRLGSDCSGQHNGYWLDSLHVEPNDTIFANGFN